MDGLRLSLPRPPFPLNVWKVALQSYFDAAEINAMLEFGWDFAFTSEPHPKDATRNLASALQAPHDVDTYIKTELEHGAILGPFNPQDLPFQVFHSPLGTVPKVPVRRTITDCSQIGEGINSFISAHDHRGQTWKITLPTTATIVDLIKENRRLHPGKQLTMFKCDYSRWYRWFRIDPGQAIYFAIAWNGFSYIDACLSFGNRAAALCAQRVMWSVLWIFRTKIDPEPGVRNSGIFCSCPTHCSCGSIKCAGYIDDTICVAPEHIAQHQYNAFIALCGKLGLRLSTSAGHMSPPATRCVALGLLYNLEDNTVSLPSEKVASMLSMLDDWIAATYATDRQLASLVGHLLYAANCIRSGHLLSSRVLATKRLAASINRPVLVDEACKADFCWWKAAISMRKRVSFLEHNSDIVVAMDASGNGWHKVCRVLRDSTSPCRNTGAAPCRIILSSFDICDLETVCHVVSCHICGHTWNKKQILGQMDNQILFYLFTNGRARNELRLKMARFVASEQVRHKFIWKRQWIPTETNILPDALSRLGNLKYKDIFIQECERLGLTP